jgi:hypothetical protein
MKAREGVVMANEKRVFESESIQISALILKPSGKPAQKNQNQARQTSPETPMVTSELVKRVLNRVKKI